MMYDNNPKIPGFQSSNNFSEVNRMQLPIFGGSNKRRNSINESNSDNKLQINMNRNR